MSWAFWFQHVILVLAVLVLAGGTLYGVYVLDSAGNYAAAMGIFWAGTILALIVACMDLVPRGKEKD